MVMLRRCLGLAGGIAILALVLSVSGGGSAAAQGPFAQLMATIVNTKANPVPVRDVTVGQQPFQVEHFINLAPGQTGVNEETVFTVPAGKRLVIESLFAQIALSPGDATDLLQFVTEVAAHPGQVGIGRAHHKVLASPQGSNSIGELIFVGTHAVRAYADPGTAVNVQFIRKDNTDRAEARFSIVGYLVDVL